MKRFLIPVALTLVMLWTLSACGCDNGETADLVVINDSDAVISAVVVNFEDRGEGSQNADGSPLKRGESFGFEAGEYPVTVAVYETPPEPFTDIGPKALATTVIRKAPPDGERWYVTVQDGGNGLVFIVDTRMPAGM